MNTKQIVPHYSSLAQADMDMLTSLVTRAGYGPVVKALGDILTQTLGPKKSSELSVCIGLTAARADEIDRDYPPEG